jgi:hypothetical protein
LALIPFTLALLTASTTGIQALSMVKQGRETSNRDQPTAMMARVHEASGGKGKGRAERSLF